MLALALVVAAAASPPDALYPGQVIDRGTLVHADQVVWPPKDRHDQVVNGWIYQIRHADGSVRKVAQMNGRYFPDGAQVLLTFGDTLRLENAATYREPARPSPEQMTKTASRVPARPNTVDEVLVNGRREQPPIFELAERATGKDWNNVYCQTETRLGSRLPLQRCLSLRGWDMEHQEALAYRCGSGGLFNYCVNPGAPVR